MPCSRERRQHLGDAFKSAATTFGSPFTRSRLQTCQPNQVYCGLFHNCDCFLFVFSGEGTREVRGPGNERTVPARNRLRRTGP